MGWEIPGKYSLQLFSALEQRALTEELHEEFSEVLKYPKMRCKIGFLETLLQERQLAALVGVGKSAVPNIFHVMVQIKNVICIAPWEELEV